MHAVTSIETTLQQIMRQEDSLGPQAILEAVIAQHSLVRMLLKERIPEPLRTRMLGLYSNMSRFIGWVLFNLNDFQGATRYYEIARTAAHEADDDVLSSFVLCNMSHLATWSGDPRLGVEHALGALAWASRAGSNLLSAYANDVGARAYAGLVQRSSGNAREQKACRTALDRANSSLSDADSDDPASPHLYFYGAGQLHSTEAECMLSLSAYGEASDMATKAIESIGSRFTRNLAFCRLTLAAARLREDEPAEAANELMAASELATLNLSPRLVRSVTATRMLAKGDQSAEFSSVDKYIRHFSLEAPGPKP